MTVSIFVFSLIAAMALGMPIAYSLLVCGVSLMAYMAGNGTLAAFDTQILAQRFVDGADNFKRGDLICGTGQSVAAIGAGMGDEEAGTGERLENLGQQRRRYVVGLGDVFGALGYRLRRRGRLLGEVLERHETVVGFFGQTEHRKSLDGGITC